MENNENISRANLGAFVTDPRSLEVINVAIKNLNISNTYSQVGNMKEVFQYLSDVRSPKILIIDISNSELPMSDIKKIDELCEPGTYLIVVGNRNDVGIFRALLRIGVVDYIIKPIQINLVTSTLQNLIEGRFLSPIQERLGKTIIIAGSRGGVGASFIAANIAYMLVKERSKRVLLWDFDIYNGIGAVLLDVKNTLGLKDFLAYPERIDQGFFQHSLIKYNERFSLISTLESLDKYSELNPESVHILINLLISEFHYIVVDIGRNINEIWIEMLKAARHAIIISDPSIVGIRDTLRIIEAGGFSNNKERCSVILNNVGKYQKGEIAVEDFSKAISMPIETVINFDNNLPMLAANMGRFIVDLDSPIIKQLREIVTMLSGADNRENFETIVKENFLQRFKEKMISLFKR